MKDEYLKAFQQRIEEIKALDVSPEEKRKLAADAKTEILDQYKASYIREQEEAARRIDAENQKQEPLQVDEVIEVEEEPEVEEQDPIGNILNKLEEREERGEVGIELDTPTEFMDPDALFSTMNLDDLFSSLGIEDDDTDEVESEELIAFDDDIFMDSEALFAGLLDEIEDEVESDSISNVFEIDENTTNLEPNEVISEQVRETFNMITNDSQEEVISDNLETTVVSTTTVVTEVEEVEELVEGSILDDEELENITTDDLSLNGVNELKELEKERERAQKIGAIEIALLVVLIVLVIIVVYLIIGV